MRKLILPLLLLAAAGCGETTSQDGLERGLRELRRDNWSAARTQFEKSISLRPGSEQNLEAYNYLGIACWKLGKMQDAIEAFESARRLSPIAPEPTYNLGVILAESGDTARALQALKDAALMDDKDPRPLEYMGALYLKRKQWPEARRSFYAAKSRAPASPRILTSIALIELETEKPETAAATLQGALAHDDRYAPALFNLGYIHHAHLHDDARARLYLEKFLALETTGPQADYARRALAAAPTTPVVPSLVPPATTNTAAIPPVRIPPVSLPAQPPNYSGGVDLFAKAREAADHGHTTEAVTLCHQIAAQAAARGDKPAQEKALRTAIQLAVDSAQAHAGLAAYQLANGQHEAALKSYKVATTLDASLTTAHLGLGRAATAEREYDTALVALKHAVATDPSNPEPLWLLAQLYDKNIEAPPAAVKAYTDFVKLFPSDPRSTTARDRTKILSVIKPVIAQTPPPRTAPENVPPAAAPRVSPPPTTPPERTPPPTLPSKNEPAAPAPENFTDAQHALARGIELQQRGEVAAAKRTYLRAIELKPDSTEARYNLALLHIETKDHAAAENLLTEITRTKPTYANAWLALGQVYARDPATLPQAKSAYRKFLELAPTHRSAPGVRQWLMAQ